MFNNIAYFFLSSRWRRLLALVDGQALPMTETNRPALESAVKSGKDISWTWSKTLSLKQGGSATPAFEVRYLDTKARAIPDLQITITK